MASTAALINKAFKSLLDVNKSRTIPRADVEALLTDSGIDLETEPLASVLAAATHDDGTCRIDTSKSNILFRVSRA